jgi:VWFA-related protein
MSHQARRARVPARAIAATLVVFAVAVGLLGAAPPQQRPVFRAGTDLVQVNVVVRDANGQPVEGLTKRDFTLLDDKQPQQIVAFTEYAFDNADAPIAHRDVADSRDTAQAERVLIIVVDDLHIFKGRTDEARALARQLITSSGAREMMAVLFTSGEDSTELTPDRTTLLHAVDALQGRRLVRRPTPPCAKPLGCELDLFFADLRELKTLQDAARLLGPGGTRRKAIVMVSEGMGKDFQGLFGTGAPAAVPEDSDYATTGMPPSALKIPWNYQDYAALDMMESLRRANVTLYAVDPRGRVRSGDLMQECFPAPFTLDTTKYDDACWAGT